jgi:carboxyl-terminal processing protease
MLWAFMRRSELVTMDWSWPDASLLRLRRARRTRRSGGEPRPGSSGMAKGGCVVDFARSGRFLSASMLAGVRAGVLAAALALSAGVPSPVFAAVAVATDDQAAPSEWSNRGWRIAKSGRFDDFLQYIQNPPETFSGTDRDEIKDAARVLNEHIAKREGKRSERLAEVNKEFDERLGGERTPTRLALAMRSAIELWVLTPDKNSVLEDPRVKQLTQDAENAARSTESNAQWLAASELYSLLNALYEDSGRYKGDLERQTRRLSMIRLYVPQRLWELRNDRLKGENQKQLPPYNPTGDDFNKKLQGVDQEAVVRALARSADHVEQVPMRTLLAGGLGAVETMIGTHDLHKAFPGLDNDAARETLLTALRSEKERLAEVRKNAFGRASEPGFAEIDALLTRVLAVNDRSVKMPREAILHEFGNGAMDQLDEFSAIIWPDELSRFNRNTQGKFVGIGVQIELDDQSNVKVVSPIEGTPAFRAGIRSGDVIKKIDGKSAYGMGIDQVVDNITGPEGTKVILTIDRPVAAADGAPADQKKYEEIELNIQRQIINVVSVKGWKRNGAREDAWDWFIDRENQIGYVRLTQFSENTAAELRRAVNQMQKEGLRGMVMDLRFNPGGYLDQAVQVSNLFVDSGVLVAMQGPGGRAESPEVARSNVARLSKTPVVVLINEGSASASEIVSGTLQHYGETGDVNVMVMGQRSFGKGSVQKVFGISDDAAMKLTMQYYAIPDAAPPGYRIIHRKPGAHEWGIAPTVPVEMLPKQTTEAILLRRDADVLPGDAAPGAKERPNADKLLTDGMDLQLESALAVLKVATIGQRASDATQAMKDK